jgi:hypothetical protein
MSRQRGFRLAAKTLNDGSTYVSCYFSHSINVQKKADNSRKLPYGGHRYIPGEFLITLNAGRYEDAAPRPWHQRVFSARQDSIELTQTLN